MNVSILQTNMSTMNNTNCTIPDIASQPPTLSGGSAAFILIALMLGCLSQPAGSLVVSSQFGASRIWRFSPLLAGLEGLVILICLLQARYNKVTQKERAFTVLAKRTTSTHEETKPLVEFLDRPKLEMIIPMMLQIFKVVFITGAPLTTAMAVMYWLDWATIQYCQCWVWWSPAASEKPRCRHTHSVYEGAVCKLDWRGRNRSEDSIKTVCRAAKWIGIILLFLSNVGIAGSWFKNVYLYMFHLSDPWPWYKKVPLSILLPALSFALFWGGLFWISAALIYISIAGGSRPDDEDVDSGLVKLWVAIITFVELGIYYNFEYDDTGTYKPAWLDWLG